VIVVIGAPYGAEVKVETAGRMGCRVVIQRGLQVLEIGMTDEQARELVRQLNAHLDRRAAELTLAMLEAERERRRRRRGERPEALAAQVVVLEAIRDSKTAPVAAGPLP